MIRPICKKYRILYDFSLDNRTLCDYNKGNSYKRQGKGSERNYFSFPLIQKFTLFTEAGAELKSAPAFYTKMYISDK